MKRFGIIIALGLMLLGFCGKASAQFLSDGPVMKGRMVYGGGFGFGLRGNYLNLSLSPQIGYRIFNPWEVGVRGTYNLQCYFDRLNGNEYAHFFGISPYTNVEIFRGLFLHVEDEVMYGFTRWNHETVGSRWYNTVFVGGGFRRYSYSGGYAYVMVLYNLSWGIPALQGAWDTPYSSPITIRVGYCL